MAIGGINGGYPVAGGSASEVARQSAAENAAVKKVAEAKADAPSAKTDTLDTKGVTNNGAGVYNKNVAVQNKDKDNSGTSKNGGKGHGAGSASGVDGGSKSALQIKNEGMRAYAEALIAGTSYTPGSDIAKSAYAAAEATSAKYEDYWSVDATAERIFTFGKSLAGEDEGVLKQMRAAFEKGYGQAVKKLGKGNVGDVTTDTYKKVNDLFDKYEKELADKKAGGTSAEASNATS
ncbi:hypothetical protein FACS1894133_3100 [Clostridia bacterium]|nr:hypothetical protein FACS1894133_3100 [Clostridia bacterium]